MSFDLQVAAATRPEQVLLETFLSANPAYASDRRLDADQGNVVISRQTRPGTTPAFTVDGPHRVEPEDLAAALAAAVLAPRWLVEFSVPAYGTARDVSVARALARHIAEWCDGAVYDPQADAVVWPRGRSERFKASHSDERIRLVTCQWFLPDSRRTSANASHLLELVRRHCPEAVPIRFGTFEPLQGRLDRGNDTPFVREWDAVASSLHGGLLFFQSRSPCFGGSVSFADQREENRPRGAGRALGLTLDFDGRALQDDRWRDAVVSLFVQLARRLGAFYAMAYIRRNVIARRGRLWLDGESESYPLPLGRWWPGVPPTPTWLAWFGVPYRAEVESALRPARQSCSDWPEGILLEMGRRPADLDQLKATFPSLPGRILARMGERLPAGYVLPGDPQAFAAAREREKDFPAEWLPDIQ